MRLLINSTIDLHILQVNSLFAAGYIFSLISSLIRSMHCSYATLVAGRVVGRLVLPCDDTIVLPPFCYDDSHILK